MVRGTSTYLHVVGAALFIVNVRCHVAPVPSCSSVFAGLTCAQQSCLQGGADLVSAAVATAIVVKFQGPLVVLGLGVQLSKQ